MRLSAPAIATALWATAAFGQSSFIGQPDQLDWNERATTGDLQRFAECAVRLHPKEASQLVLDVSGLAMQKYRAVVFDADCLSPTMLALKIPPAEARFAIAYALVRNQLQTFDPSTLPLASPLPVPNLIPQYPPSNRRISQKELQEREYRKKRAESVLALQAFGECVVRANPHASRAVLFAKPNSADETQAFNSLMPALSGCLIKGHEFRVDKSSMRGALAVNYYRLAMAPKVSAPATVTKQ